MRATASHESCNRRRRVMSTSRNGVSTAMPIMSPTQKRSAALREVRGRQQAERHQHQHVELPPPRPC